MEKKKSKKKSRKEKGKLKTSDWIRQFSAGGAVYKKNNSYTHWLIIQPTNSNRWQLPKGRIEKGEKSETAAVREVQEEGGILVKSISKIGKQEYFFYLHGKRIFKIVTFYLMEYIKDSVEGVDKKEIDKAEFVDFETALKTLTFDNDKEILQQAKKILEANLLQI